jgi:hypothetical protein
MGQKTACITLFITYNVSQQIIENSSLYINLAGGHVNEAEMPVAIINRKNIADWCSKDRKILVTPSYFVVRSYLLTSLLIYIYL